MKRKRICIKYGEEWRKQPGDVGFWCYHALETDLSDSLALLSVCSWLKVSSGCPKQVDFLALQVTFLCSVVEWVSLFVTVTSKF